MKCDECNKEKQDVVCLCNKCYEEDVNIILSKRVAKLKKRVESDCLVFEEQDVFKPDEIELINLGLKRAITIIDEEFGQ